MFVRTCPEVWAQHCGVRGWDGVADAGGKIICIADPCGQDFSANPAVGARVAPAQPTHL